MANNNNKTHAPAQADRKPIKADGFEGVYYYMLKRKNAFEKQDCCYYFTYKDNKKLIWRRVGKKSDGFTPHMAFQLRQQIIAKLKNAKNATKSSHIICKKRGKPFAVIIPYEDYLLLQN